MRMFSLYLTGHFVFGRVSMRSRALPIIEGEKSKDKKKINRYQQQQHPGSTASSLGNCL